MFTVSFVILTHGEDCAFALIEAIKPVLHKADRLLILNDPTTPEYEAKLKRTGGRVINHVLAKDYAAHRNAILDKLKTDYALFIDADETPAPDLLKSLQFILETGPDGVWLPRLNVVEGVKPIHALQFNWQLTDGNVVNWPDMQCRLFRLKRGIKFVGELHERLKFQKHHKVIALPPNKNLALIHPKSIETQLAQNARYNENWSEAANTGKSTQELLK